MFVVVCLLFCLKFNVARNTVFIACCMLRVACFVLHVAFCMLRFACCVLHNVKRDAYWSVC